MLTNRKSIYYLRLFLDLIILNTSFVVAAILAQSFQILIHKPHMFILLAGLNFLWYFVSNVINFYEDYSTKYFIYRFTNIVKIVIVQVLTTVLFVFFVKELLFTRNFIIFYAVFLLIFISLRVQIVKYILVKIRGKEKNLRNVLIIGAGDTGRNFQLMLQEHSDLGYNTIGFIDNNKDGENILGKIKDMEQIISGRNVEVVVIALPFSESFHLDEIIAICSRLAVRTHIIPDYFSVTSKKFQVNVIGDFPIITVRNEPLAEAHWQFIKRIVDIVFSLLVFIFVLSWLFPLISLLNKISGNGSILFVQDRLGVKDRIFQCYKFRTMYVKSENKNIYQPTYEGDPRVTKIGRFLRKSNIDELPQFINILKGEMSVVGPRPHPLPYNEFYKQIVDEIKIRSWVKPGLTGWAQVHGYRGDVVDEEENKKRIMKRIEYDLWYIENWSIWLDIQIILLTIWQMIKGETKAV
ncbi:MAG: exopolysaccharide biosynthesis polyprenyl glycosylphosphotransferase [Ignavibacteriaceae bacterium]